MNEKKKVKSVPAIVEEETPILSDETLDTKDKVLEDKGKTTDDKQKKKFPWKYIINIVLVLGVTLASFLITLFSDLDATIDAFSNVNWGWIAACFGLVALGIGCTALILYCFARLYTRKYKIHQALACDAIGRFWSGVTPGATGGQFMQVYTYNKQGIPVSAGASIMIMYSIVYQSVLIIYGIVSLACRVNTLIDINAVEITINGTVFPLPVIPIVIIGFLLNLSVIGLLFLMSYSRKFHNFIMGPCITLCSKIRLIKNPDKSRESLRIQVENFKIELKRLLSNIPFLILTTFLFALSMTCFQAVPAFAAMALGTTERITMESFWDAVFYSNFHQMVTGLIPIPGSAGVSEYFFSQLFSNYYMKDGVNVANAAQLIWRTVTFTVPLLIGGFIAAFYRSSPKNKFRDERSLSRETYVALKQETFAERAESAGLAFETARLSRQAIRDKLKMPTKKKSRSQTDEKEITPPSEESPMSEWDEVDITDEDEK